MMVGPLEGRFLEFLVRQTKREADPRARHLHGLVVHLDGDGAAEGGRITTCDVNEETTAIARRYAEEAGVADRIEYRLGPGARDDRVAGRAVRPVFIDADKENYVNYYEAVLPKLADDGFIIADNVLWSGRSPIRRTRMRTRRRSAPSTTTCWPTTASSA